MAKRIIPFWLYPMHWGLKGKAKEQARINYLYDGYEADVKTAHLNCESDYDLLIQLNTLDFKYNHISEADYELKRIKLYAQYISTDPNEVAELELKTKLNFNLISEKEYDEQMVELIEDEGKKFLAALKCSLKYSDITQNEYDKEVKTFHKEPWFSFDIDYDEANNDLIMSFDYNEYFWKKLRAEGHPGVNEYEIIDNFIKDWGRKLVTEDYNGDYDTKLVEENQDLAQQIGSINPNLKIYD